MKKTLLILLLGIIGCIDQTSIQRLAPKDMNALPEFNILLTDTITKFNTNKLPTGKPVLLFFFGPNCPYCDTLTRNIITDIDTLKDTRLLMISVANFHDAKTYEEKYQLKKYANVMIGVDYDNYFTRYYKASGYPLLVIYDKNKKIKRAALGFVSIDTIRAIIDK